MGERIVSPGTLKRNEYDFQTTKFASVDHFLHNLPQDRKIAFQHFRSSSEFLDTVSSLAQAYDYLKVDQRNKRKTKEEFETSFRDRGGAFTFEKFVEHNLNNRTKKFKKIPPNAFCIPNTHTGIIWNALHPDREKHVYNSLFLGIQGITVPDMLLAEFSRDDENEEIKIDGFVECTISERKFEDNTQSGAYRSLIGEDLHILTSRDSERGNSIREQIVSNLPYALTSKVTFTVPMEIPVFYAYPVDVSNVPETIPRNHRLPMAISSGNICDFADAIKRDLEFQRLVDGEQKAA